MAIKSFGFASAGGGASTDTLDDVTGRGATTTNAITVGGVSIGTEYSLPTADGSSNQVLQTNGSGTISFATLDFTGGLEYKGAFNATAGTPSLLNAEKGDFYIIDTAGTIYGQTWAVGDHLLINEDMGGTITNSKIDKIDNTQAVTSVNTQTGAVVLSGNDLAADHTASNYTPANSNIDGHFSGVDTKLGTLLADITNESLNDLSDVSYTAGAGIDNYVLTYDHSSTSWGAEAVPSAPVSSVNTQTGAVVLSGNDLAADHTASNYTAANSNIDGHLSGIDTKFGTLGTASTQDVGTSANNVVQLDASSRLPAVDGSQLTNLPSAPVTSVNTLTGAVVVSGNDILADHTASNYTSANNNVDGHFSGIDTKFGTLGTASTQDVGTSASNVVQLDGSARLPAVDGSQLTNLPSAPVTSVNGDTGAVSVTLDSATDQGATTTNAITVGGVTTSGDILADADASRTIGAEATRFITYHGDMNGAIRFKAKNNQGSAITKGQVVYISGVSGTVPEVKLARANSASTMPAFGLALANANDQAEVQIITFGNLTDYNTTTYSLSANDTVFVSATTAGALTNSAPTGESNLIQNIGRVVRADASAGIIKVGGAGRSNATPNLDQDKVFLGNASNQSVSTALSAIGLSKFNNDSNFLTNINNESLNDLSDVSYTAGAGIDNYVLTYDHSSTSWGAEVVPSAPVSSVNTLTGAVVVSGNDILADHTASNYTAANNNVDGHFSGIDTKFGTLGTASTSAATDFLSATGADTLGGDLDVGTSDIVSSSNNNIEFSANGTGVVKVKPTTSGGHLELDGDGTNVGKLRLMCEQSSHGIYLTGPSHSASASYTLKFPDTAGTADYVLKTDGSGNLDWVAQASGGGNPPTVTSASPSSNYTISTHADNEEIYILTPSADISVFLPAASSCGSGYKYQIKNMASANTLTIDPNSTETIDGSVTFILDIQYSSVTLVTDGSNWFII